MYKHISHQQSQLELPLLWSESSVAAPVVESPKSEVIKKVEYTCSVEEFKAQQELERDLMSGRGAWLYKQLERELAWERAQQKALDNMMAMRAANINVI
ncbi:MAG: hypothetical protein II825_06935 [Paludibacteraceae bacterium]|nr:hypothetical protein [Paludibacteraceae bacterium]